MYGGGRLRLWIVLVALCLAGTLAWAGPPVERGGDVAVPEGMGAGGPAQGTRAGPYPVSLYIDPGANNSLTTSVPDQASLPDRTSDITFRLQDELLGELNVAPRTEDTNLAISVTNTNPTGDINVTITLRDDEDIVSEAKQTMGPGNSDDHWTLDLGDGHTFSAGSMISLQISEQNGNSMQVSYGNQPAGYAHLVLECEDHIPADEFDVFTTDSDGDIEDKFQPNAIENKRVIVFSGVFVDVFGSGDVEMVEVTCERAGLGPVEAEMIAGGDGEVEFTHRWEYDAGMPDGDYPFDILATDNSGNNVSRAGSFRFLDYGVYIYTTQSYKEAAPGESAVYDLVVLNTGGKSDTIDVDVDMGGDGGGWTAELSETEIVLNPGAESDVTLTVDVPSGTGSGLKGIATVTAGSEGEPSMTHSVVTTTTVGTATGFEFTLYDPSDTTQPVAEGESVEYVFNLRNRGDATVTYSVALEEEPEGEWAMTLTGDRTVDQGDDYIRVELEVRGGDTGSVTLEVFAPEYPTYTSQEATLRAWSANDTETASITVTTIIEGSAPVVELGLDVDANLKKVEVVDPEGEELEYDAAVFVVAVTNYGNVDTEASLGISDLPPEWTYSFSQTRVEILPGNSESVDLEITPAADELAGTYNMDVEAFIPGAEAGSEKYERITVEVDEFFRFQLEPEGDTALELEEADGTVTFELNVTNTGNKEREATLKSEGEGDWMVDFEPAKPKLKPGESQVVAVSLTPPSGIKVGDKVTVSVMASYGGEDTGAVDLTVEYKGGGTLDLAEFFKQFGLPLALIIALVLIAAVLRARMTGGGARKRRGSADDEDGGAEDFELEGEEMDVEEDGDLDDENEAPARRKKGGGKGPGGGGSPKKEESQSAGLQI